MELIDTISTIFCALFGVAYKIAGTIFVVVVISALFGAVGYMIYYIIRYGWKTFDKEFISR